MISLLLAQGAAVLSGEPGYDHIAEVAVVANFLAEAEGDDIDLSAIEFINRSSRTQNSTSDFLEYARGCSIDEISVISSSDRSLPISVLWDCGRFVEVEGKRGWEERVASFWVREGRVIRIAFGESAPINIQPQVPHTD